LLISKIWNFKNICNFKNNIILSICVSGKCLLHRLYLENKSKIDADILARLLGELQNKKEEEEEEAR
jgi:hypothetical protein